MSTTERFSFAVTFEPHGAITVLAIHGQIDPLAAAEFQKIVDAELTKGGQKYILDLTHLRYIGSIGLQVVIGLANTVRQEGGVYIANPNENVRSVLDLTKITQRIPVYPTREDALDAARSR
ncbi:MAG: STAS domain-containing protein [Bacteroidales bacterium]|nr:STAS domain-containing protein [Bacteroidales bacterium]